MKNYTLYYCQFEPDMASGNGETTYLKYEFQVDNDFDALSIASMFVCEYAHLKPKKFTNVEISKAHELLTELLNVDDTNHVSVAQLKKFIEEELFNWESICGDGMMLVGPTKTYKFGDYPAVPEIHEFKTKVRY